MDVQFGLRTEVDTYRLSPTFTTYSHPRRENVYSVSSRHLDVQVHDRPIIKNCINDAVLNVIYTNVIYKAVATNVYVMTDTPPIIVCFQHHHSGQYACSDDAVYRIVILVRAAESIHYDQ